MEETGNYCHTARCYADGYVEFCGYCPRCWIALSDAKRKILFDSRCQQPAPVIERHEHQHYHPPQSRVVTFLVGLAGGVAGAVLSMRWFGW